MKVMVTGATGFLGLYIVEQLAARGDEVRAFCRRATDDLRLAGIEPMLGDIRDRTAVVEACRGVDAVIHTAAIAGIWGPWKLFHETNTLGTQYIIEGCRTHDVPRLVFTSSPSVTFDGSPQRSIDEAAPYPQHWLAHYPHTKALAEQAVTAANTPGVLHTASIRPHLIWGPRDRHLIPRLLDRARSGQLKQVGSGENLIDITYVENAAAAHVQLLDALATPALGGRRYFLSQGDPVNCWQWINEILALAGLPPVRSRVPYGVARFAGALLEGASTLLGRTAEPRMTRFLAAQLAMDHYFDIGAARRDFGYAPAVSTQAGMQRLVF